MKIRWILLLLLAGSFALAGAWALGFFDKPEPTASLPTPPALAPARKPSPLNTAAWMLANSRPEQPPATNTARSDDDSACGPSRAPCPENSMCIDGGCLATACSGASADTHCALPNGGAGACCGDRCLDLAADGANCGHCGATCRGGMDCVSGKCEARSCGGQMAGASCSLDGAVGACCRGQCADRSGWARDAANCGGCGHRCPPGLSCEGGACVDPASGGPPAWTCFDEGHACPEDSFCVVDACYPRACASDGDGLFCAGAGGQVGHCCGGACTDLFSDSANCRACGVRCAPGEACKNGTCGPP